MDSTFSTTVHHHQAQSLNQPPSESLQSPASTKNNRLLNALLQQQVFQAQPSSSELGTGRNVLKAETDCQSTADSATRTDIAEASCVKPITQTDNLQANDGLENEPAPRRSSPHPLLTVSSGNENLFATSVSASTNSVSSLVSILAAAAAAVVARTKSSRNTSYASDRDDHSRTHQTDTTVPDNAGIQHLSLKSELSSSPSQPGPPSNVFDDECATESFSQTNSTQNNAAATSRNAAKTLKCPKCNWHYKYHETLEIHMREKHAADDVGDVNGITMQQRIAACLYCQTQRPHPRLGRGETYSCGYKPYQCEVCNYSTTSKGNLSIHMQSDKHLNNVAEVQKRRQKHSLSTVSDTRGTSRSISPTFIAPTINNSKKLPPQSTILSKHQHHESPLSTISDSNLGFKCGSEISLLNEPTLWQGERKYIEPMSGNAIGSTSAPTSRYKCDLCTYETSFARNLKIHQNSDKHLRNITANATITKLVTGDSVSATTNSEVWSKSKILWPITLQEHCQANPASMKRSMDQHKADLNSSQLHSNTLASDSTLYAFKQLFRNLTNACSASSSVTPTSGTSSTSQLSSIPSATVSAFARNLFVQMLSVGANQNDIAIGGTPQRASNNLHSVEGASLSDTSCGERYDVVENSNGKLEWSEQQFFDKSFSDIIYSRETAYNKNMEATKKHKNLSEKSFFVYQCCVCDNFASDSAEELYRHETQNWMSTAKLNDGTILCEELYPKVGEEQQCALCNYKTESSAEMDKHRQDQEHKRLIGIYFHIYCNGPLSHPAAQKQMAMFLSTSNQEYQPVDRNVCRSSFSGWRCNVCNFDASSVQELKLHEASAATNLPNNLATSTHVHGVRILVTLRRILATISRQLALKAGYRCECPQIHNSASLSPSISLSLEDPSTTHSVITTNAGDAFNLLKRVQYCQPVSVKNAQANPVYDKVPQLLVLFDKSAQDEDANLPTQVINDKNSTDDNNNKVDAFGEEVCEVSLKVEPVDVVPVLSQKFHEDSRFAFNLLKHRRCFLKCSLCAASLPSDDNLRISFGVDLDAFLEHMRKKHVNATSSAERNEEIVGRKHDTDSIWADGCKWLSLCVIMNESEKEETLDAPHTTLETKNYAMETTWTANYAHKATPPTARLSDKNQTAELSILNVRNEQNTRSNSPPVASSGCPLPKLQTTNFVPGTDEGINDGDCVALHSDLSLNRDNSMLPPSSTTSTHVLHLRQSPVCTNQKICHPQDVDHCQTDINDSKSLIADTCVGLSNKDTKITSCKGSYGLASPCINPRQDAYTSEWRLKAAVNKSAKLSYVRQNVDDMVDKYARNSDIEALDATISEETRSATCSPPATHKTEQLQGKYFRRAAERGASEPTLGSSIENYGLELVLQSLETTSKIPVVAREKHIEFDAGTYTSSGAFRCVDCSATLSTVWLLKAHVEESHRRNVVSSDKLAELSTAVTQHSLIDLLNLMMPLKTSNEAEMGNNMPRQPATHNVDDENMAASELDISSTHHAGDRYVTREEKDSIGLKAIEATPASHTSEISAPASVARVRTSTKSVVVPDLSSAAASTTTIFSNVSSTASSTLLTTFSSSLPSGSNITSNSSSTERILSNMMNLLFGSSSPDGRGSRNTLPFIEQLLTATQGFSSAFQSGTNGQEYSGTTAEQQRRYMLHQLLQAVGNSNASAVTPNNFPSSQFRTDVSNVTSAPACYTDSSASMEMPAFSRDSATTPAVLNSLPSSTSSTISNNQHQKRARTRITDDQLKVLRANFDINNSPSDEQYQRMCTSTFLPLKVVKHWFRNTLFKERQKNKDSPYNFNIPPLSSSKLLDEFKNEPLTNMPTLLETSSGIKRQNRIFEASSQPMSAEVCTLNRIGSSGKIGKPNATPGQILSDRLPEYSAEAVKDSILVKLSTETAAENDGVSYHDGSGDSDYDNESADDREHQVYKRLKTKMLSKGSQLAKTISTFRDETVDEPVALENVRVENEGKLPDFAEQHGSYTLSTEKDTSTIVDMYYHGRGSPTSSDGGHVSQSSISPSEEVTSLPYSAVAETPAICSEVSITALHSEVKNYSIFEKTNARIKAPPSSSDSFAAPTMSSLCKASLFTISNQQTVISSSVPVSAVNDTMQSSSTLSNAGNSKRANRTKFSEYQLKSLQNYFDKNPYPKDDDLEYLSTQLKLAPRVITVWFQNQRQKARKNCAVGDGSGIITSSSSSPSTTPSARSLSTSSYYSSSKLITGCVERTFEAVNVLEKNDLPPKSPTTPSASGTEFQCKACLRSFVRRLDLIRHQQRNVGTSCASFAAHSALKSRKVTNMARCSSTPKSEEGLIYRAPEVTPSEEKFSSVISLPTEVVRNEESSSWCRAHDYTVREKSPEFIQNADIVIAETNHSSDSRKPTYATSTARSSGNRQAFRLNHASKSGKLQKTSLLASSLNEDQSPANVQHESHVNSYLNILAAAFQHQVQQQSQQAQSAIMANLYSTLVHTPSFSVPHPVPVASLSSFQPANCIPSAANLFPTGSGQPTPPQTALMTVLLNTLLASGGTNSSENTLLQFQHSLQSYNWLSSMLQQTNPNLMSAAYQQQQAQLFGPASTLLSVLASSYAAAAVAAQGSSSNSSFGSSTSAGLNSTTKDEQASALLVSSTSVSVSDECLAAESTEHNEIPGTAESARCQRKRTNSGTARTTSILSRTISPSDTVCDDADNVLSTKLQKPHNLPNEKQERGDKSVDRGEITQVNLNCGAIPDKHEKGEDATNEEFGYEETRPETSTPSEFVHSNNVSAGVCSNSSSSSKRVRSTILPEQYDYLFQQFKLDSNPSRTRLEAIANRAGLVKRVVQVWYQNTRARERKGTLNVAHQSINKRCPVCNLRFSARSALEQHLSTKHSDEVSRGTVSVDVLPDSDSEGPNEEAIASLTGVNWLKKNKNPSTSGEE